MNTVHIHRLHHRSHIRGVASTNASARINTALASMLDEGLEASLLQSDINFDEEICIRRLHVRRTLSLARSDMQLATDISVAWAFELQQLIEQGGPDVIRYRSRMHVLVDMAFSVASGDMTRVWAWRQLGLWPNETHAQPGRATALLVNALAGNGKAIVPVLMKLEEQRLLTTLTRYLTSSQLIQLARAALDAAGLAIDPAIDLSTDLSIDLPSSSSLEKGAESTQHDIIARIINTSELASALAPFSYGNASHAAAALVLLAAETGILFSVSPQAYIQQTVQHMRQSMGEVLKSPYSTQTAANDAHAHDSSAPVHPSVIDSSVNDDSVKGSTPHTNGGIIAAKFAAEKQASRMEHGSDDLEAVPTQQNSETAASEEVNQSWASRLHLRTEWGGLLFLLSLIESSGALELAVNNPQLQLRGLRWVLNRIAMQLLPLKVDDGAALAFSGITAANYTWLLDAPAATSDELLIIEQASELIVAALRDCLEDHTTQRELLLHNLCRRDAQLFLDPGWIEVRLSLDTVSTTVRRSGLDRNPDWLPWLGAVVRFVYA